MRTYLELIETPSEGDVGETAFIRIDVTGWSEADIEQAISLLKEHAKTYTSYTLQRHFCRHDTSETCTAEIIDSK
jgi:hypothetical protein